MDKEKLQELVNSDKPIPDKVCLSYAIQSVSMIQSTYEKAGNFDMVKVIDKIMHQLAIMKDNSIEDDSDDMILKHDDEPSFMSIKEFRDLGLLQEVNRTFFHPIGLALAIEKVGNDYKISGIIDERKDDSGIIFINLKPEKIETARLYMLEKHKKRHELLGYIYQTNKLPGTFGMLQTLKEELEKENKKEETENEKKV